MWPDGLLILLKQTLLAESEPNVGTHVCTRSETSGWGIVKEIEKKRKVL